ncbi:acetylcholine receptor subunit alpha-1-B-like isoform X2 [Diachasma alloeum]|uniref:acetylcholine receptor subunit alpha-1-B-like isoform X2 n=1 Tax=Diachasma alloeum TaxID=454923 RepID=UPI0007383434|nr:acetylcholine receptor subunit alpha-1-B-like isoform X2 [Diachasma alloeum]
MTRLFVISSAFVGLFTIFSGTDGLQNIGVKDATVWNETWIDKLKTDILANYDTHSRPAHHNSTITVYLGLQVYYVTIDEFKSAVNVRAYMTMVWDDDKLRWDASKYGGVHHFQVRKYEIWEPDILLLNGADTSKAMSSYGLVPCHIHYDGTVSWAPPVQFLALCDLDFRLWPFDTQRCTLRITSAASTASQMDLKIYNNTSTADLGIIHNTEWQLKEMTTGRELFTEKCCPDEPFVTLRFNLTLKRSSVLYKSVIVTPTVFIVFLNLVIFWLPPQSKEKLVLCGFLSLMISYFLVYFMQKVPPLLSKTPLIARDFLVPVTFYSGCLYQVTISLVISIVVINLSRKPHCRPPPRVFKEVLMGPAGEFLRLSDMQSQRQSGLQELTESPLSDPSHYASNVLSNHADDADENKLMSSTSNTVQLEWILIATAIDRISFSLFCVVFAVMGSVCIMS